MVPYAYKYLFQDAGTELISHKGWDPGALSVANYLAASINAPVFHTVMTRLLIEPNRSPNHPELFSSYTNSMKRSVKLYLMDRYYFPYRDQVEEKIGNMLKTGSVIHLSVHSFTPVLQGQRRSTDIGLLFDPKSELESSFCNHWRLGLLKQLPGFQTDFNCPYQGTDDGFTAYLRHRFPSGDYAGIELELNQKWLPFTTKEGLMKTLEMTLKQSMISLKKKNNLSEIV
jgi:predicted N-formylglutamate amidohydrolase